MTIRRDTMTAPTTGLGLRYSAEVQRSVRGAMPTNPSRVARDEAAAAGVAKLQPFVLLALGAAAAFVLLKVMK